MSMHINQLQQTSQQAFAIYYKYIFVKNWVPFMALMLLIPSTVSGSCILILRTVYVQGIWVLDTL